MSKFYVVVKGRETGIFRDWSYTSSLIKGYKGAIYKSFNTFEEAENFYQASTQNDEAIPPNITFAYTDGSFSAGKGGFGFVAMRENKLIKGCGEVKIPASNNVAELYAIYVVLSLMREDIAIYTDSNYALSCLTSYIHVANSIKANADLINACADLMKGRRVYIRHVDGHAGIEYNEMADRLAERGRLSNSELIIE